MYALGHFYPNYARGAGASNGYQSAVLGDGGTVVAIGNTDNLYSRLVGLGLINSASLVNSCNGGKADALYNFVPSPVQSLDRFVVTRASTKLRIGSNGLYGSVANNVPAFEFNTDGTYRGLLVEPGATNLVQRSRELSNVYWGAVNATMTADATSSLFGDNNADSMVEDAGTVDPRLPLTFAFSAGTNYTLSVFAKVIPGSAQRYLMLVFNGGYAAPYGANFDLVAGTVGATVGATGRITAFGNGWYRCEMTPTTNATGSGSLRIRIASVNTTANISAPSTYTGDGTSGFYLDQAQLETGSVATSPIVTTGSTAARVADVISLTSASSLIGQGAGTIYIESEARTESTVRAVITLSDNTATNRIRLRKTGTDVYAAERNKSAIANVSLAYSSAPSSGIVRIAIAYNGETNGFVIYGQGSLQDQDTGDMFTNELSQINLGALQDGSSTFNGWIRSVALFPTRLANATLASLTTL